MIWRITLVMCFTLWCASISAHADDQRACVDVAVVAVGKTIDNQPLAAPPGYVSWSGLTTLQLHVRHLVFGQDSRKTLPASSVQHGEIRDGLFLFFLQKTNEGYHVVDLETDVTRASDGRYIVPILFEPRADNIHSWMPPDYKLFLHPVHYKNDFWTDQQRLSDDHAKGSQWLVRDRGQIYAKQSLYLDEIAPWIAYRDSHNCRRFDS